MIIILVANTKTPACIPFYKNLAQNNLFIFPPIPTYQGSNFQELESAISYIDANSFSHVYM